jgi:hypothetical protein
MSEQRDEISPNASDFEDLHVTGWDGPQTRPWVEAVTNFLHFLREHDRETAIGMLTLAVIAVECCMVGTPWTLAYVVTLTVAFATYLIRIGPAHGIQRKDAHEATQLGGRPESA